MKEAIANKKKGQNCKTVISTKRSFEAASAYARAGKKTAVLNFASSTNPGGGVTRGSSVQEECLCRCSTLYPCLDIDMIWKQFYKLHRQARDPLYNNDCLDTPGVIAFNDCSITKNEFKSLENTEFSCQKWYNEMQGK